MTNDPVELSELIDTRSRMDCSKDPVHGERRDFLLSFKRGEPDWSLFDEPSAAELPAIRWKLMNIQRLAKNPKKHHQQLENLEKVLDQWLQDSENLR